MKTKRYANQSIMRLLVMAAAISVPLFVATSANAQDWSLAGNWVVTVPSQAGQLILVQSILPQDETGLRYTSIMRPAKPNYTFFGIFPDAAAATPYTGQIEKGEENSFTCTLQKYVMKKSQGPVAELVYIEVANVEGRLVDENTMEGDARVAVFSPEQDADEDGFPDPDEEPMFCQAFSLTAKRQTVMPAYELTPAPMPFCECGTGIALRFGAGGALWDQLWSAEPWNWYKDTAPVNMQFLGEHVAGELETTTAGVPEIDENMVLRFSFGGQMTLNAFAEDNPEEVIGQIIGDADGVFVADIHAGHATIDDDENIVIAFGADVHDAPDAKIKVVEKTGVFANIKQIGTWRWYVRGTITIARLPDTPVQDNILVALQDNDLLLHAEEEFVLTGWYYRTGQ